MARTRIKYHDDEHHEHTTPLQVSKKNFLRHLGSYIIIVIALTIVNYWTSPTTWWVQWVALGWGIAIAFQFWRIYIVKEH